MDLLSLVVLCSPLVDPATTLRVIDVESGGHPYAIHDNTDGRGYDAGSSAQAVRIASALIRAGHRVDLGLMQINYEVWLRPTGFSLEKAFDACTNVRLGTTILSANYAQLLHRSGPRTDALQRALSVYNSGSESRSSEYAQNVLTGRTSIRLLGRGF
jgi:type IV secretion system protein VirB1